MTLRNAKRAVAKLLTSKPVGTAVGIALRDRIPFRGERIDTAFAAVTPDVKSMLFFRLYETGEVHFIHRFLGANLDVIELGGSIGAVSKHILTTIGTRRLVIVEANPDLLPVLRANVEGRAEVLHRAIAYGSDTVSFHVSASSLGGSVGPGAGRQVDVPTTSLADIRRAAGFDTYALVCDIEGAEHALVAQEADELRRCQRLIIELHDSGPHTIAGLARALETTHGFRRLACRGPVYAFTR
jgi:FkbM family methyltransferase